MEGTQLDRQRFATGILLIVAVGIMLTVHGALPGFAIPTLGQALWATGFSLSFVNDSLFTIHAHNFGAPEPAAIAFGLAGAYPVGLLIAAGLHPADAYSAMAAFWLTVAFVGAWRLAVMLGLSPAKAVGTALIWMTMPVIWAHSGYSMLSLGLGLLPLYFFAALRVFKSEPTEDLRSALVNAMLYAAVCVVAIFMDGYSFMMFAVGASALGVYIFWRCPQRRWDFVRYVIPVHVFGFASAYLLYRLYVGVGHWTPSSIDQFRAYGVDLSFLVVPTKGIHWLWDQLGLSVTRSPAQLFGDHSVWTTTFSAPVILFGVVAWWRARATMKLASGVLLVALFGLWMSLGPSLKVDSIKPPALQQQFKGEEDMFVPMSADLADVPTGNAWLSQHLPGFDNMRAAYRWIALATFGFWVILIMWAAVEQHPRVAAMVWVLLVFLLASNLPHPIRHLAEAHLQRVSFLRLDQELTGELGSLVRPDETVAFLPWRNDFLINYLAGALNIRTYNIGGDRNLSVAVKAWPPIMRQFPPKRVDKGFSKRILSLLSKREADAVVLPYIDTLWDLHLWPLPKRYEEDLAPVVRYLREFDDLVRVQQGEHFVVVRLLPGMSEAEAADAYFRHLPAIACGEPVLFSGAGGGSKYFTGGWSKPESWGTWSDGRSAEVVLPLTSTIPRSILIETNAAIFTNYPEQAVDVLIDGVRVKTAELTRHDKNFIQVTVPDTLVTKMSESRLVHIGFRLPNAIQPKDLGINEDTRQLALGLIGITLR